MQHYSSALFHSHALAITSIISILRAFLRKIKYSGLGLAGTVQNVGVVTKQTIRYINNYIINVSNTLVINWALRVSNTKRPH